MARAAGQKDYTSLVGGLVTEASPLTFPEGATSAEYNFVVNKNGMLRERRKGFSSPYDASTLLGITAKIVTSLYWRSSKYVLVVYTTDTPATYVRFHALDETFSTFSDVKIADVKTEPQIAELKDYIVITFDNNTKPILIKYDDSTENFTVYNFSVYIRDFELVDDGLGIAQNPTTLSNNHEYNLLNAGWWVTRDTAAVVDANLITAYHSLGEGYPSNAQSVAVGMTTDANGNLIFEPDYVKDAGFGNSLAPRGHYIYNIDLFDREARRTNPEGDGSVSTTLIPISTVDASGSPSYDPDIPSYGDPDLYPDIPWNPYPLPNDGTIDPYSEFEQEIK